jgi:uncharacterized membrane protein
MSAWKKLLWVAVTILGVVAIAVLASSRGEQISALWIIVAGLCALSVSYRFLQQMVGDEGLVLNDERSHAQSCETMAISCPRIVGWFWTSLRGDRRSRSPGRSGPSRAVWIFARHSGS